MGLLGILASVVIFFVYSVQSFFLRSVPYGSYFASDTIKPAGIDARCCNILSMSADNGDLPSSVAEPPVMETKVSNSDMFKREVIVTNQIVESTENAPEQTPYEAEVSKYQNKLEKELEYIQSVLTCEQGLLKLRKDSITVSGKNGYFFVQAEVAEFQKKKDKEQKARVLRNKKEFVQKMLPVVDAFRAAPMMAPAENEREESMHKNFGSLCDSIIVVFEKYGFKEFNSEIGSVVVASHHEVSELVDGEDGGGIIVNQIRAGISDKDGEVLRRSLVTATRAVEPAIVVVDSSLEEAADN